MRQKWFENDGRGLSTGELRNFSNVGVRSRRTLCDETEFKVKIISSMNKAFAENDRELETCRGQFQSLQRRISIQFLYFRYRGG